MSTHSKTPKVYSKSNGIKKENEKLFEAEFFVAYNSSTSSGSPPSLSLDSEEEINLLSYDLLMALNLDSYYDTHINNSEIKKKKKKPKSEQKKKLQKLKEEDHKKEFQSISNSSMKEYNPQNINIRNVNIKSPIINSEDSEDEPKKKKKKNKNKKNKFVRREGDWKCPKCSNINFEFRLVCNRCLAIKPKKPEDKESQK
ncbi:MAG: zinc finger Ran-binding domain-containing protein [archaeon]|nr:zinc finger Ran-binding domain-containing protein [archaeon]